MDSPPGLTTDARAELIRLLQRYAVEAVQLARGEKTTVTVPTSVSVGGCNGSFITESATMSIDVARKLWIADPSPAVAQVSDSATSTSAEPFATTPHVPHALRLALGSVTPDVLRAALRQVRRVIDEGPR